MNGYREVVNRCLVPTNPTNIGWTALHHYFSCEQRLHVASNEELLSTISSPKQSPEHIQSIEKHWVCARPVLQLLSALHTLLVIEDDTQEHHTFATLVSEKNKIILAKHHHPNAAHILEGAVNNNNII